MQEKFQIPHKKICLTVFIVSCLILTIFYYDNTVLNFASIPYTAVITWDVRNDSVITSSTPKALLSNVTSLSFNTTPNTTINFTSTTTTTTTTTSPSATIVVANSSTATSIVTTLNLSQEVLTTTLAHTLTTHSPDAYSEYLVTSSKCKIPNFQPFNKEAKKYYKKHKYKSCTSKKLLTHVNVIDNTPTLFVEESRVPSYSSNGVTCCYSNVTRVLYEKDPDSKIKLSTCKYFENSITVYKHPVYVKCLDIKSRRQVYENVHATTIIDDKVQKKINNFDNTTKTFSVLFVGIDSISRLNFIRALPNTYKFVEENGWLPLKGYNKIDDNTFPNLMAILTGFNQSRAYSVCNPKSLGKLDKCPILWYNFRDLGYVTGYAEDEGSINTFNYRKKGFSSPPVDYYYRPYILGTEKLTKVHKDGMTYCTGPESAGERIMNIAKDFAVTFKNYPNFGFFWMNSFSHNEMNSPSGMDNKVKDFLETITKEGVTNNTIVIFISDHGMRFGPIRKTSTGWIEERLPFIYVSFPDWFKDGFPREYENFKTNSYRLTSPYDLHMTLKHILVLSGRNFNVTKSEACPTCKSLFEEADTERSCADAGIEQHWCTCSGFKNVKLASQVNTKLSEFLLNSIHDIIRKRNSDHRCAKYSVGQILATRISQESFNNNSYILFHLETKPKAVFESTIRYVGDINTSNFSISGDISRLDSYNDHSKCVSDAYLRKYCYCRSTGERI